MWRRRLKVAPPDLGPYTYEYQPEFADPEPWRLGPHGGEAVVVGLEVLVEVANPARLQMLAATDNDRCLDLEADIKEYGIREPLVLIIDAMGRVCMKEGHHRTIVAGRIGMTGLPVRFTVSGGRVAYGKALSGCLDKLLLTAVREAARQ